MIAPRLAYCLKNVGWPNNLMQYFRLGNGSCSFFPGTKQRTWPRETTWDFRDELFKVDTLRQSLVTAFRRYAYIIPRALTVACSEASRSYTTSTILNHEIANELLRRVGISFCMKKGKISRFPIIKHVGEETQRWTSARTFQNGNSKLNYASNWVCF